MMFGVVTVGVVIVVAAAAVADAQHYSSRWDNVQVEPILKNERLLKTYFRCVMDEGKCSPDAAELKKNIPDALENECAKCTEKQRENVEKVMKFIFNKKPDMFKQLEAKYDPKGVYRSKYQDRNKENERPANTEVKPEETKTN
ncbi:ejaculatory bulb-specific protein 3-like [Homalodisca vitripennis]|uniref:ejaculatory bulb-specific protein 3-like n=1 Tax=Homalodisca vitripennis TaxID=197043 RepID=UPI001EECECB2|nr:ejaculatory bulb-specific protein 3-like [Homalodisca vitripennis]